MLAVFLGSRYFLFIEILFLHNHYCGQVYDYPPDTSKKGYREEFPANLYNLKDFYLYDSRQGKGIQNRCVLRYNFKCLFIVIIYVNLYGETNTCGNVVLRTVGCWSSGKEKHIFKPFIYHTINLYDFRGHFRSFAQRIVGWWSSGKEETTYSPFLYHKVAIISQ